MPQVRQGNSRSVELILIYTGNGKGKTCASVGQALRALGNGLEVAFGQFIKRDGQAGEQIMLASLLGDNFRANGAGFFRNEEERPEHMAKARELLAWAASLKVDMLVLDEALYALNYELIKRADLEPFLDVAGDSRKHLVLSGRNAPQWLIEMADTVTEALEIKHALRSGVKALAGVEY